jgi:hypothetical protein
VLASCLKNIPSAFSRTGQMCTQYAVRPIGHGKSWQLARLGLAHFFSGCVQLSRLAS